MPKITRMFSDIETNVAPLYKPILKFMGSSYPLPKAVLLLNIEESIYM